MTLRKPTHALCRWEREESRNGPGVWRCSVCRDWTTDMGPAQQQAACVGPRTVPCRSAEPNGGRMAMVDDVLAEVRAELERAYRKFPRIQSSAHEGYAVLAEEVDELWDDVKANRSRAARAEAVQVSAMAVRFIVDLFKVNDREGE